MRRGRVESAPPMPSLQELPLLKSPPLIGSLLEYRRDFLGLLRHIAAEGDIVRFKIMGQQLVMINSPELIQELLVTNGHKLNKSKDFLDASAPLAGHGLFTIKEDLHKQDRKLMAADFTPKAVAKHAEMIVRCADEQIASWDDGQDVAIGKAMVELTVRVIGKVALGVDLLKSSETLWKTFTVAFEQMRGYLTEILPIPLSFPTPSHLAYQRAVAELDKLIYKVIEEHRRGDNQSDDVVNRLLRVQAQDVEQGGLEMTDKQIRDELVTLLLAGHETTASALAFSWSCMACDPAIYSKAVDEVDRVLEGREPTAEDAKKLTYVGQIFHESLRKYPPLYVLDRQNVEPITLGGYELPANTAIIFAPYTLHRRQDTFPDPETFDPDRFAPDRLATIPRMGFLPFSAGHRVCLGSSLAMLEASLIMARFLQKIKFVAHHPEPPRPEPMITLRPDPSYHLRLVRR